jgi:hypothetical protein
MFRGTTAFIFRVEELSPEGRQISNKSAACLFDDKRSVTF